MDDDKLPEDPSEEEIKKRSAEIREGWSEERLRNAEKNGEVGLYRLSHTIRRLGKEKEE